MPSFQSVLTHISILYLELSERDIYIHTQIGRVTEDWNVKVGSQEISGVTSKFGLEIQNEAGQRLTELCQENKLVIENTLFQHNR